MRTMLARGAAVGAAVTVLLFADRAVAADCTALDPTIPIVWIESGDTQEPLLKKLGQRLINSATPLRIVYKLRRTCDLGADIYNGNLIVNDTIPIEYIPSTTEDSTWTPSKVTPTCTADAGGNAIQLGIGATFLSSCAALPAKPADITVFGGPIQSYGFVVPPASSQIAITAEEGYFAFGYTEGTGQANPWSSQALRFIRGPTASTALTTSAAIGLLASQLKGTVPPKNTSDEILNFVSLSTNVEPTIGIMGTEIFDNNRGTVKLLAFKAFGQKYAYYPDAKSDTFDKQNVRDGHYLPWAPTEYILHVDTGTGLPIDPAAQRVKELVLGEQRTDDVNGIDQVILAGLVPDCAMRVTRDFDGGDLRFLDRPAPCACYFESKVPEGHTSCKTCSGDNDPVCGAGKCRRNFCEAR